MNTLGCIQDDKKILIPLTLREIEVAKALALGRSCADIAKALDISTRTVDTHRANILRKLCLDNNVMLARHALRHGLVDL